MMVGVKLPSNLGRGLVEMHGQNFDNLMRENLDRNCRGADTIAGVTSGEGAPPVRAKPMDGSMELEMFQAQQLVCGCDCDLRKIDNAEL